LLRYRALNQPDKTAYIFLQDGESESDSLTYGELDLQARVIATQLQGLVAPGEAVLLLYPPGREFITAFFGCLNAGVIAVPVYPPQRNQKKLRLQSIVADAQIKVMLTSSSLFTKIEKQLTEDPKLAELHCIITSSDGRNDLVSHWQQPTVNPDTLAFLQYTSGSTGTPKGVMVSHGNLMNNSEIIYQSFGHSSSSQGVIWLPPYHDMGLIGGIIQPLYGGFPVVLMSPIDFLKKPIRWLKAISNYKATTSGGPNFAYEACLRSVKPEQLAELDLSSWEIAFTGAEPVRFNTLERFASTFEACGFRQEAFYPCYGMAEATLFVSGGLKLAKPNVVYAKKSELEQNRLVITSTSDKDARTIVSCGHSWLEHKIVIATSESLNSCNSGVVGEILVSGSSVAKGYWNDPNKTKQTFSAYLADTGEGPFLRTGDLGFLQDGELFVTGRVKELIIIRGQNHYPQDIELTVQQSHPALRSDCGAAFTVDVNDEERLIVVQEVERSYLRKLNEAEVIGNIRQAITAQHS